MIFAVIGAGAVGGYYGGRLAVGGEDVHFLCRSNLEHLRRHPLIVRSIAGDFETPVRAHASVVSMPKADVVLVTVKAASTREVAAMLPELLGEHAVVLSVQNGLGNEEIYAASVGEARVYAGSVFICAEATAPGVVEHTASGAARIGYFSSPAPDAPTLGEIAAVFKRCGVTCGVDECGRRIKWRKLIWNIPFNGLSVFYGGVTTDVILADPAKRAFARRLMEETIAAAGADGIVLEPGLIEEQLRVTESMGAYRTSMMVDFINRRPLEVETILEEPLRRGRSGGLTLPAMEEVCAGVNRIARCGP